MSPKMPNLNMVICRVYVSVVEKNSRANNEENLDSPSILVISLSKAWNFLSDGSVYEGREWRHKRNRLKFLPGHGEFRPWHHARRHVFQAFISFFYSWKPNKQMFVVDYCHTFHQNICPFLVKGMRIYYMARAWFSRPFLWTLSCTDCLNLNYVH